MSVGESEQNPATRLAVAIRELRVRRGLGRVELAAIVGYSAEYVGRAERPRKGLPSPGLVEAVDRALDAGGALIELRGLAATRQQQRRPVAIPPNASPAAGEPDRGILGLAARAEASDVGPAAVETLEEVADLLARSYARTPPHLLLVEVRRRAGEVAALLDGRSTLSQRRRLLVAGGWLSLLAATLHVDLGDRPAAAAARATAASLGRETDDPELRAWAVEIAAWTALIDQDWRRAARLAAEGLELAPARSSAAVQLTAQSARAAARLGDGAAVRAALARTADDVDRQSGGRPHDHHFVFDGRKLAGYTATSLAWLRDPAGERVARDVVRECAAGPPRRLATARIDLGLVLARAEQPDEAGRLGLLAVDSGQLVPSNRWRAAELADALSDASEVAEAVELRARLQI